MKADPGTSRERDRRSLRHRKFARLLLEANGFELPVRRSGDAGCRHFFLRRLLGTGLIFPSDGQLKARTVVSVPGLADAALGAITAEVTVMPCETDLYFTEDNRRESPACKRPNCGRSRDRHRQSARQTPLPPFPSRSLR